MDVARWVRPAIEHAQDVFWLVRPGVGYNFALFFVGSCFVFNLLCIFYYWFFPFCFGCVLFSKIKSFGLGLFFNFFVFYSFVFRLESSLQKNKLSSSKLVLIRFGYRGFSFLNHAVRLWFVVFSKLRWLVWIIIKFLSNRVNGKFETC